MKKSSVFLFVMSILLFLPAAVLFIYAIQMLDAYTAHNELKELYTTSESGGGADNYFRIIFFRLAVIILIRLIPVIVGIIGSLKRGRFTAACIALGSLYALYVLFEGLFFILQGSSISFASYGLGFTLYALYTAAAAVAFKYREAV